MKPNSLIIATIAIAGIASAAPALAHWDRHPRRHPLRASIVVSAPRPVTHVVLIDGRPGALIDLDVSPETTRVFVNGSFRGTCDDFDGFPQKLTVRSGRHHLRLVTPDGQTFERDVEVAAGTEVNLELEL